MIGGLWSIALLACYSVPSAQEQPPAENLTVESLWLDQQHENQTVEISSLTVISPRLSGSPTFFVQDQSGSPAFGLRVELVGKVNQWPPPIGSLVEIRGTVRYDNEIPSLELARNDDASVVGVGTPTAASPEDLPTLYSLVSLSEVTIASPLDPGGRAQTDGPYNIENRFGVELPDHGNQGDLVGILTTQDRLSPRTSADWNGTWDESIPMNTTISDVKMGAHHDGSYVKVRAVQATPWSRDERWTVIQDAAGQGIWVDGEHWIFDRPGHNAEGEWLAEVRDNGRLLRVWESPLIDGVRETILTPYEDHGAIIEARIDTLGPPDRTGERTADNFIVDDRFIAIDSLVTPIVVTGAVLLQEDDDLPRICPF